MLLCFLVEQTKNIYIKKQKWSNAQLWSARLQEPKQMNPWKYSFAISFFEKNSKRKRDRDVLARRCFFQVARWRIVLPCSSFKFKMSSLFISLTHVSKTLTASCWLFFTARCKAVSFCTVISSTHSGQAKSISLINVNLPFSSCIMKRILLFSSF